MAGSKATPLPLDHKAIAAGLGELKEGSGYSRVLDGNGKTVAYIKKSSVAAHLAHLARLPKKLGTAEVEKNGVWANVKVADTAAARAVLEHVVAAVATAKASS